jgi:hypothetical protein
MAKTVPDSKPKPRSDAYTGMLLLSLLILIGASVLVYLDYSQYPTSKPPAVPKVAPISNPLGGGGQPQQPGGPLKK